MGTDERNFRSSYYEKVGCLESVEKISLSSLLKEDIRSTNKLKHFIINYAVPAPYRGLLWGIIMNVYPKHKDCMAYVVEQRDQVYQDLKQAVLIMRFTEPTTKEQLMYMCYLLENNLILYRSNPDEADIFMGIVRVLIVTFESDVEIYWLAKGFYEYLKEIHTERNTLKELASTLLKREDVNLQKYLEERNLFTKDCTILDNLFASCFASVVNPTQLIRIWDKICGGSRKIVVFVFNEFAKSTRKSIFERGSVAELKTILYKAKEQETIVSNAIKAWQSNKSHSEIQNLH